MDVAGALERLLQDSAQVERAVVLDAVGSVLGSTLADEHATERLASAARELAASAGELHSSADEVTRIEVELEHGAVFLLREGERAIVAITRPNPTGGLVAYDLRTCLSAIDEKPERKRRRTNKTKQEGEG
jgi:predicted regulator of Ras-like GTPase activity (Roadblock/LC7/MglB family)